MLRSEFGHFFVNEKVSVEKGKVKDERSFGCFRDATI